MLRKWFLQKVISFTKLVLQTLRTQFRQKRQIFFPRRRKLFAQYLKGIWKYEFFPEMTVFSNCSEGHVECSFDNPAENNSTKGGLFSGRYPKITKKVQTFRKMLSWNWSSKRGKRSFDNLTGKNAARRPQKFNSMS